MTKRLISIVLLICLIFTFIPFNVFASEQNGSANPVPKPFNDVLETDWYYESVKYAVESGIFKGVGDNSFSPGGTMTRGMFVTVLGRIAGIQASDYPWQDNFSDVDASAWYAPYVVWASENNITKGIGNNKFGPDELVTREQMAVFIVRFFEALGIDFSGPDETAEGTDVKPAEDPADEPKDLSSVSDWAKDSVLRLWKAGIFKGDENGYFNPQSNATRAEGATISMRVHQSAEQWYEEHSGAPSEDNDDDITGNTEGAANGTVPGSTNTSNNSNDNSSDDDGGSSDDDSSGNIRYTVGFQTNGGSAIDTVSVPRGGTLSSLPIPQGMGFVFLGWYTDAALTTQFTAGNAVNSNLTLYAKYAELQSITQMEDERFALADQQTSLTFTLAASSSMTNSEVLNAITLARADESEPEALAVLPGTDENSFIVSADGGFTAGAAYTLTLNEDALSFSGREQNYRVCNFTIAQQESDDLPLSSDIIYIQADELSDIVKNGVEVPSLSAPLVSNEEITEIYGTFTYTDADTLSPGDTLCIYTGNTVPNTDASNADLVDTEIAYIAVTGVSGTTVSYTGASARNVLALPDTLPIYVGAQSPITHYTAEGTSFTTDMEELDFSDFSAMGLNAGTTLDVGDYLFFYTNPNFPDVGDLSAEDILGYAVVNDVVTGSDNTSVTVTYETVTEEEMREGLSYYSRTPVSGETLLGDTDIARLEESLEQQAMDSGFARDAAVYLSTVAMATNGFEDAAGGRSITVPELSAVYAGAASQQSLMDSVQVRVNASIGSGTRKIGRSGVRAEITVNFEVPVSAGDNEVIISGSATFVEEVSISLDASGSPVWDHWWFIYWIKDYNIYSYTNVYNYTGMFIEAQVRSQGGGVSMDISDEIQELLTSTDSAEIISGAGDLLDAYCDLIQGGSDWIELFEQNIFDKRIPVLFGIIQIKISADFVVSAYINVALGTSFEYSDGTCYAFYGGIFARNFRSYTIDLADEVLTFRFYTLGELGIRAGIRLELAVGLFNCDWNSVGFTAEAGVYGKLYGYFYYEYTKVNSVSSSLSTGALYFELGIYLEINFVAQVCDGQISSTWTLYENEWPLLYAGSRYPAVDFVSNETPEIRLKDEIKSFTLPESFLYMRTLDLQEGSYVNNIYPLSDFNVTFTNNKFSMNGNEVVAAPDRNDHILECDMTIAWRHNTMAFSSLPISRTYHIHWDNVDESGYQLSFDSLGGSYANSIHGLYLQPITLPTPVKTGYSLAGWYSDNAYTQQFTSPTMPAENLRLYAKWDPNRNTPYVVYHYKQDLTNESSYTLADTERLTGTTNISVTPGVKYYTGFSSPGTRSVIIAPDGSTSISYYYTRNSYSLTFDARFTTSSDPYDDYKLGDDPGKVSDYLKTIMVKYGARVSIPAFTRSGWYVSQWSPTSASQLPSTIEQDMTMPAHDLSFKASWTLGTYTVILDANGGSVDPASKTVIYTWQYGGVPTPWRIGYTFAGWYFSEDEEDNAYGTRLTSDTVKVPGNHTLYAKWQALDYTVTFDANGGDLETGSKTVTYHSRYGDLPIPVKPGHTFLGWYLSEDGNGTGTQVQEDSKVDIADSHTLYAKWFRWAFTVTFDANGGDLETDGKGVAYLSSYGDLPIPVSPGFIFLGWYLSEDEYGNGTGTQVQEDSIVDIQDDHTLYARWDFTVTFDASGGDLETYSKTVIHLSRYGGLPIPVSPGFTFLGWYLSVDEYGNGIGTKVQEDSIVSISHDHTLYASWERNDDVMYTVRHHLQSAPGSVEYILHETETSYWPAGGIVPIHHKSIAGYIGTGYPDPLTVLEDGSSSADLYYNIQSYSLYYFDGSGDLQDLQFQAGAPVTPPEDPQKPGFRFTGWDPAIPATMPMNDVTVMPTFEKKTYTITLSAPDAVPPYSSSAIVEYEGTTVTDAIYNPERPGFVFTGWNTPEGNLLINTNGTFYYAGSNSAYLTPREDGTCYWVYDDDITLTAGWDDCSEVNSFEELQLALANPEIGNIMITNTLIVPNDSVIDGGGRTLYFRNSNPNNSMFELSLAQSCTFRNMTIDFGGNVGMNVSNTIVMENVTLKNATMYALMNNGHAFLRDCSVTGSRGENGVIFSQGETLKMINCSVFGNAGDGINCAHGTLTMDGSSVTDSTGKGIRNGGGQVLLNNCTIANNGSDGIYTTYGTTNGVNVTVAGNRRGSVLDTAGGATFVNSVLVDNKENYGDVTQEVIGTVTTLVNCLTGRVTENWLDRTDCREVEQQTVFHAYENGCPVLTQLADGTWAARLSENSPTLTGGCATFFSAESGSAAYGSTPTYIAGSEGAVNVTTYQGGAARTDGVIGACNP